MLMKMKNRVMMSSDTVVFWTLLLSNLAYVFCFDTKVPEIAKLNFPESSYLSSNGENNLQDSYEVAYEPMWKRAPSAGFFGMRGKKVPGTNFYGMRGKKGPAGFLGMRGKKMDSSAYSMMNRGLWFPQEVETNRLEEPNEEKFENEFTNQRELGDRGMDHLEKRIPGDGFMGVRGKRMAMAKGESEEKFRSIRESTQEQH